MDLGKSFRFGRKDGKWFNKLMIGSGFYALGGFLGFPVIFLYGYGIRIVRNVLGGQDEMLPEWDNYGEMAKDGVKFLIAQMLWILPVFLLLPVFGASFNRFGDPTIFSWLTLGGMFAVMLANFFALPGIALQIAKEGTIASALRVGDVMGFARRNFGKILKTFLLFFVASVALLFVAGMTFFTVIGPILILIAGMPWLMAALYHMFGQLGAEDIGVPGQMRVLEDGGDEIQIVRPTVTEAEYVEAEFVEANEDKAEELTIEDDINWL